MTMRRTGVAIAAIALGGCCGSEQVSDTGYASMMVYGPQISACIVDGDCARLCADKFGLDADVEIVRCEITSIDRQAPGTSSGVRTPREPVLTRAVQPTAPAQATGTSGHDGALWIKAIGSNPAGAAGAAGTAGRVDDLSLVVGVRLRVTYVAPAPCEFGVDVGVGDDGWSDDSSDDGSTDDGSTDDGSDNDPGDDSDDYPDDGSDDDPDDDGGDDGSDDGSDDGDDDGDTGGDDGDTGGDDGGGDDGGGDDGGGDDGGWGGTMRGGGARGVQRHAEASDHRPEGAGGARRVARRRAG